MKQMVDEKALGEVWIRGYRCRCGHEWLPRNGQRPSVCPKCKSPRWDKPKQSATRSARVDKHGPRILKGLGLDD